MNDKHTTIPQFNWDEEAWTCNFCKSKVNGYECECGNTNGCYRCGCRSPAYIDPKDKSKHVCISCLTKILESMGKIK